MVKTWAISSLLASTCALLATAQDTSPQIFSQASNDSLLWGPYRPNLYFGLRPRLPKSILTGLLWSRVEDFQSVQNNCRYTCEQNAGMEGYGWESYDPRTGGVQVIHDKENGLDLETSFVKFEEGRGGWGARIRGSVREDAVRSPNGGEVKTAVWFTVGAEGLASLEAVDSEGGEALGYEGNVVLEGQSQDLGEYRITITESKGSAHPTHPHPSYEGKPLDRTLVHSLMAAEDALTQAKAILFNSLKQTVDGYLEEYTQENMPPPWQTYTIQNKPGQGNFQMVQKTFEGDFEFDVLFAPASASKAPTSEDLTKAITSATSSFGEKYLDIHKPQAPFTDKKYLGFSKSMFSNLIGGIGYFYGDQVIDRSYAAEYDEENEGFWKEAEEARARNQQKLEGPYELFTSIPSRPFFPRGFLWDEGFHLLPILDWDADLVMQILTSWFNTMDSDGWIPREQILGPEARTKVPTEFQVQYPHYANPPTLFMVLESLLDKLDGKSGSGATLSQQSSLANSETVKTWLKELYPLLQRNFDWYKRTQWGDIKTYDREAFSTKEGYRWRGRTPRHILTSGLDDYPRAQPPHPGELHVDLISWMGLMSRNIRRIADFLGEEDDAVKYKKIEEAIRRNVGDLHWSAKDHAYCDATIDDYEESVHVCHKGYISLFPFMSGLVGADNEHLKDVLDLIGDEEELWSPHGVRSLSKKDELYGSEENYWRSPVWMNMNYLIVKELYVGLDYHRRISLADILPDNRPNPRPSKIPRSKALHGVEKKSGGDCI